MANHPTATSQASRRSQAFALLSAFALLAGAIHCSSALRTGGGGGEPLTRRDLVVTACAGLRGLDWSDCVEYGLDQP